MRVALIGLLFCAVGGCTETRAEVNCQGNGAGITCSIKHTQGSDTVSACFDMVLSCRNGKVASAHSCQVVAPSQVATKNLIDSDFTNLEGCEVSGSSVTNLVITKQ